VRHDPDVPGAIDGELTSHEAESGFAPSDGKTAKLLGGRNGSSGDLLTGQASELSGIGTSGKFADPINQRIIARSVAPYVVTNKK
jgi:hypothetical protein